MTEAKTLTEARKNMLREINRNDTDHSDWFLEALEDLIEHKIVEVLTKTSKD